MNKPDDAESHLFKVHEILAKQDYTVGVSDINEGDTYKAIDIFFEKMQVTMCGDPSRGGKWLTKPHMRECMPIWFGDKVSNI